MKRKYDKEDDRKSYNKRRDNNGKSSGRRDNRSRDKRGRDKRDENKNTSTTSLVVGTRDNDPNWYFTDAALADQVSRLAFQNLAGYGVDCDGQTFDVPNLVRVEFNPSAGVNNQADYTSPMLSKSSGINLAGFKLFSKLSAYTGRVATYGPQDISTMILAFGEIISMTEWIRRAFGVAYVMSMRNRSYPRDLLAWGMLIDDQDFFEHLSDYRTQFNTLITMINQLPIPKGITYFDKCASMYEKLYLDMPSSMAQTVIPNPYTTWVLDETSFAGGTILKTTAWHADENALQQIRATYRTMGDYLNILDSMIGVMLNSSTLQVVYTDLLNLATKVGQEFWKLDYLAEGYTVFPEFNLHFSLQAHNATMCGMPRETTWSTPQCVTPWNDVYPNPAMNSLFYNPGWPTLGSYAQGLPRTGKEIIIDMTTDSPSVEDMVEVTRYISISGTNHYSQDGKWLCDAILPDHYVVCMSFRTQNAARQAVANELNHSLVDVASYKEFATYLANLDWSPRIFEVVASTNTYTHNYTGEMNFYTVTGATYMRKVHQFMTLGLYDIRSFKN